MDWPSIAALLAERSDRALALLDRTNRIRLFNAAMEKVLGWQRFEVLGRRWVDACVASDRALPTRRWLQQAQRGAVRWYASEALAKDGRRLELSMELTLIGEARQQGLLLSLDAVAPARSAREIKVRGDLQYEVTTAVGDFGRLLQLSSIGPLPIVPGEKPQRCHLVLHGRTTPCPDCPLLRSALEPWPRKVVRRDEAEPHDYEVVRAELLGGNSARLTVRRISEHVLAAIHEAKIKELSERARLSDRERAVLEQLVGGHVLDDIGRTLGISTRTVKFHQANLLEKLGADSRVDLARLIF